MVSILLTQSRAGALATVAAVALLCIHKLGRKSIVLLITIFGAMATAIYLVTPPDLLSRQIHRGLPHRPGIWETVAQQVSNAPIFGNGFQKELLVDEHGDASIANYAHNAMLATARDGGLVGLALHIAILIVALRSAIRTENNSMSSFYLSALLFGFFIMSVDKDQLIDRPRELWLFFWLPLSILLAEDIDTESHDSGHRNQQ
jgi:O-antigen ligase